MAVLIDTSAIYGLMDRRDPTHAMARHTMERLRDDGESLITHSYVLSETSALIQRRLGMEALRDVIDAVWPTLRIIWIDRDLHDRAITSVLAIGRRSVSLVDCASFVVMRDNGIRRAFAFDRDFAAQGFELATA